MRRIHLAIVLALIVIASDHARAAAPTVFSVQGVLRNNAGQLQSMVLNVSVSFFNVQTGGSALATYSNNMVQAQNGLFTFNITDSGVGAILQAQSQLWMEVTVTGFGTFPRTQVTSQLYALSSASADSLSPVCSGCVADSMIGGVSGAKVTGAVALSNNFAGALAGDVTGTQMATSVVALRGQALSTTAPTSGQLLQFNGTQWTPASVASGVSGVTASAPLNSSGGSTPNISLTGVVPIANGGTGSSTQNFVDLTTNQTINGIKTFVSGLISLANGTSNVISFGQNGVAPPTASSVGWKLQTWGNLFGIGIDQNTQWYSSFQNHRWYTTDGTTWTNRMSLDNAGHLVLSNSPSHSIDVGSAGTGAPGTTSAGWKLITTSSIFGNVSGVGVDTDNTQWYASNQGHKWYKVQGSTGTLQMTLDANGNLSAVGGVQGFGLNSQNSGGDRTFVLPTQNLSAASNSGYVLQMLPAGLGIVGGVGFCSSCGTTGQGETWFHATNNNGFGWYHFASVGLGRVMSLAVNSGNGLYDLRVQGSVVSNTTPDLAETIPAATDVETADVVCADPTRAERVVRCGSGGGTVLGAISDGTSGFVINSYGHSPDAPLDGQPLVLAGRVPIKVSIENGPIQIGDLLTLSSTPGVAMRMTEPGPTVGIALAPFDGKKAKRGTVLTFVKVGEGHVTDEVRRLQAENAELRGRLSRLEGLVKQLAIDIGDRRGGGVQPAALRR